MTKHMVPDCPCCKDFAEQPRASGRVTVFSSKGITHAVPSMWLVGRSLTVKEKPAEAFASWAWHCSVELTLGATA